MMKIFFMIFFLVITHMSYGAPRESYEMHVYENHATFSLSQTEFQYRDNHYNFDLKKKCEQKQIEKFYKRFQREFKSFKEEKVSSGELVFLHGTEKFSMSPEAPFAKFLLTLPGQALRIVDLSRKACK